MARIFAWLGRPALLRSLVVRLRLAVRLLREPSVPAAVKGLAALPVLYVLWPIDLLPDLLPVLGQLDDIGVVLMVVEAFLALCPSHLVDHHRRALDDGRPYAPVGRGAAPAEDGAVIDAEWRREETPTGVTGDTTVAGKEPRPGPRS